MLYFAFGNLIGHKFGCRMLLYAESDHRIQITNNLTCFGAIADACFDVAPGLRVRHDLHAGTASFVDKGHELIANQLVEFVRMNIDRIFCCRRARRSASPSSMPCL